MREAQRFYIYIYNPLANASEGSTGSGRSPGEREMALQSRIIAWKYYGQRSPAVYNPWDLRRVRHGLVTKQQQYLPQ